MSDFQKFRQPYVVIMIALVVFVCTAIAMQKGLVSSLDASVVVFANDLLADSSHFFREAAIDLTALGGHPILGVMTLAFAIILISLKKYLSAIYVVATTMGGVLISSTLKTLFARSRTNLGEQFDQVFTYSFPSGHSMGSMVAWLTFALAASHISANGRPNKTLISIAVIISLLVGITRLGLGVHYPTDVLAGWSLGIAWATICYVIFRRLGKE